MKSLTFLMKAAALLMIMTPSFVFAATSQQDNDVKEAEAPKTIIHKSTAELEASAITRVEPICPAVAKWAGVTAMVMVRVLISPDGDVIDAIGVSGHALLKNAAATAVRDWKFKSAESKGKPVKVDGMLAVRFSIEQQPAINKNEDNLEKAKAAVQAFPNSPEANFWLATEYVDDEQNREAVKAFNTAIEFKPDYQEAYVALIELYRGSKATEDVLRTYQHAIDFIPKSLTLLRGQAEALGDAKRYDDAVDVIKRALEINPDDSSNLHLLAWYYLQLRRFEDAISTTAEELKINPNYPAAYHNLGWAYYQMKRYEDAIATYQKIIDFKTAYFQLNKVYREMGWAMLQSNRANDAVDAFNHAIELKGDLPDVYCGLGAAYLTAQRIDEAVDSLKKGLQERPKDSCIFNYLGIISMRMRKPEEAQPYFRKAIENAPDKVDGYGYLASLLMEQNKPAEAEAVVRQGIKSVRQAVPLQVLLGSLLTKANKWADAEAQFKEVLRLDPNNVSALNDYGYHLVERNERLNDALEMIQRAVNAHPDFGPYLDSLGWAYFKLGRLDDAERYLNKALQGPYKSPVAYEHLGDIYEKQGHRELSIGMWQKALAMNPPAEDANRLKTKLRGESPKQK